jgi:hypothetical protein
MSAMFVFGKSEEPRHPRKCDWESGVITTSTYRLL